MASSELEAEPLKPEALKFTQRFSDFTRHVTVEPAGVLFLAASVFAAVCTQTLQLEKACRVNLNFDDAICTSLRNQDSDNNTEFEKKVQQYVATRLAWRSAIQSILPCIILIFVGAWSDRTGRRIVLIILPIIGEILQCISSIVSVFFFHELPVEVLIFLDAFFPGIMGGWATLFLGLFSYIGDITTLENRTHRLGFVQFCTFVGLPIGLGLSGVALKKFGYYAVYCTSLVVHLLNIAYITIKIKDPERTKEQKMNRIQDDYTAQISECVNNLFHVYFIMGTGLYFFVIGEANRKPRGWIRMRVPNSYMALVMTVEERTFRISLLFFSISVAIPIGLSIVGPLLKNYGYYWCYSLSALLDFINSIYNVFWIKDASRSDEQKRHDGQGVLYFLRTFFVFTNVKETIRVVFKKGPKRRRLRMCVLLSIVCILFGPIYGELAVLYMLTRYRFGWDELQFSMFQTYNFFTHTLGTIFSLIVFSKKLKWHDSVLGMISTFSKIAGSFLYCFAPTATIFYIAPLVEILNGTSMLSMRSIISKFVSSDELGKVNSIIGLTENLMPLVYVPLYTTVYTATMEVLPGAVFLMGASMTIPAVAVFLWLFYEHRKGVRRIKGETSNEAAIPLNGTVEVPLK